MGTGGREGTLNIPLMPANFDGGRSEAQAVEMMVVSIGPRCKDYKWLKVQAGRAITAYP